MKRVVQLCASTLLLASWSWGGVSTKVENSGITLTNDTPLDLVAGIRVWNKNLTSSYPFEALGSGTVDGKNLWEHWLVSSMRPLRAGASKKMPIYSGGAGDAVAEPIIKTGVCNEPPPRCDSDPITLEELQVLLKSDLNYYKEDYRYKGGDYLGKHGGQYSAGIFDSFCGETQFQFAKPKKGWVVSVTDITFDENNGGKTPFLWMGLSANQEYYGMDYQVLMSSGMKESWLLLSQNLMGSIGEDALTPYHITKETYVDQIAQQYQSFFPFDKQGSNYPIYLGPTGDVGEQKTTEGPMAFNAAFASGLLWQSYFQQMKQMSNLAFKQVLENSVSGGDPKVGFCSMAFLYNRGPGLPLRKPFYDTFLPANYDVLMDNPDACDYIKTNFAGFGGYVSSLLNNSEVLEEASRNAETDASYEILERWITLEDLQRFWFGGDAGNPGTPQTAGVDQDGGLLKQYDLTTAQREAIWNDVKAAFTMQAAKWGGSKISLRYDWLSNLRVAKSHLNRQVEAAFTWRKKIVDEYSSGDVDGSGYRIDKNFPFMELTAVPATDPEGFAVNVRAFDPREHDRGIQSVEWSVYEDWSVFNNTKVSFVGGSPLDGTYKIDITKSDHYSVLGDEGGDLWVKVTDSCGNAVAKNIEIKGVKLPKLLKAWIIDQDGDGNGDKIFVNTEERPEQTDSLKYKTGMTYSWPNNENPLSSDVNLSGTQYIIEDYTLKGGAADGLGGEVVVDLRGYKLKVTIADSVGPVIQYAGVQEDEPDILYVMFSENITAISGSGPYINISGTDVRIDDIKQSESNPRQWIFDLTDDLDIKRLENSMDSVRIIPGLISDALGNGAHNDNPNVPIILDKGPLQVADSGMMYLDKDADGEMDRVLLRFKQPAVGRTGTMTLTFHWPDTSERMSVKEFSVGSDKLVVDADDPYVVYYDATDEYFRSFTTYFDLDEDNWGLAILHQESLTPDVIPSSTDTLNMGDGMGPVIETAYYGESIYPERRPDTLSIKFSEPIDTSADKLFHNRLYLYKTMDQDPRNAEHVRPDTAKRVRKSGQQLNIYFKAKEHLERPGIGDSVKIFSEAGLEGIITDLHGNRAGEYNPWALIEGTVRTIITPGELWNIADGDLEDLPADTILFYDHTVDLDSIVNERPGIGFALAFSDSVGEEDRKDQTFGYSVRYFTNLGGYVSSVNRTFNCEDIENYGIGDFLSGVCDPKLYPASRKVKVFIPWNAKSDDGVRVGSGAYVQQLFIEGSRIKSLDEVRLIGILRVPKGKSSLQE